MTAIKNAVREFFADFGILGGLFFVAFSLPFVVVVLPFIIIVSVLKVFNDWSKSWFLDSDEEEEEDSDV